MTPQDFHEQMGAATNFYLMHFVVHWVIPAILIGIAAKIETKGGSRGGRGVASKAPESSKTPRNRMIAGILAGAGLLLWMSDMFFYKSFGDILGGLIGVLFIAAIGGLVAFALVKILTFLGFFEFIRKRYARPSANADGKAEGPN